MCEVAEYPLPFPSAVSNEARLYEIAKGIERYTSVKILEEKLVDAKLLSIFQTVGSGMMTTNIYMYICSQKKCELIYFYRSLSADVEITFDRRNDKIWLKDEKGMELSTVWFPLSFSMK